jgi:hypothetical protein
MDVVETLAVRGEGEPSQVSASKNIGKNAPAFDVEQLEGPGAFSAFLDFI